MKVLIFLLVIIFTAHSFADDKDKKKDPNKKDVSDSFCFQHIQHEYDASLGAQAWAEHKPQSHLKKTMKYLAKNLEFVVGFGTQAFMPIVGSHAGVILGSIDGGGLIDQGRQAGDQSKQQKIDDLGWVMNTIKQSYNFDEGDFDADNDDRDGVIRFANMVRAAWREKKCDPSDHTCEVTFPHYDPDDPSDTDSDQHIAEDIRKLDEISEKANGAAIGKDGKPVGGLCQLVVNNKKVKDPKDPKACDSKTKWAHSDDHPCQHWEFMPIPILVGTIIKMEEDRKDPPPAPAAAPKSNPPSAPPCLGASCMRSI